MIAFAHFVKPVSFSFSLIYRDSMYSGYDYCLLFISVPGLLSFSFVHNVFICLENFCIHANSFYHGYDAGKSSCIFVNI